MDLLTHYRSHSSDDEEGKILCLLFEGATSFNQGLELLSKKVAHHIGERDLKRLLKDSFKHLIAADAFRIDEEILSSKEAIEMIESVVYLEILHEEYLRKSGRRGFFIANYKAVNIEWVYFAYQVVVLKASGTKVADLLSLFLGLGSFDLNIISKWRKEDLIKFYVKISRKVQVGYFQDGSFIGFKNYKKINDVEDILQIIFDEINLLHSNIVNRQGNYFEDFGLLSGIKELPKPKEQKEKPQVDKLKENTISPIVKNLRILGLNEMPMNAKELKRVFFKLAAQTHPDKFAHAEKGTRTEIAIVDKFREIYNAYEIIEKELEKNKK